MAVNYPARDFGIKRGDSFELIKEKSKDKCIALHLPVLSADDIRTNEDEEDCNHEEDIDVIEVSYKREFCLSQEKRTEIFQMEKDRMRHASEGKASLERYRLASARIFESVLKVRVLSLL